MGGAERDRLGSWKEIASYLDASVRTVQRWEKTEGLPVRRHHHAKLGSVYADREELDRWRAGRDRAPALPPPAPVDFAAEIAALRPSLARLALSGEEPPAPRGRPSVGRRREREALLEAFDAALQGTPLLACVGGEPGIGKTTLLDDFLGDVASSGRAVVIRGRCSERLAGSEAYLAVLDGLDQLVAGPGGALAERLLRLIAPAWYAQVAPLWKTADAEFQRLLGQAGGSSPERLKREFAALLAEIARELPVVLLLDDVHWADPSTVELLAYLATKSAGQRLLMIAAYRPTELLLAGHPFQSLRNELVARGVAREIEVGFLTPEDVGAYVAARFPENDFPEELPAFVHARTEGNGLFMVDLLAELERAGILARAGGGWSLRGSLSRASRELPASVRSMIARKIEQLGAADRALLEVASVQGAEFDSAVVARAAGRAEADVETRLAELARVHALVRPLGERALARAPISLRYGFLHGLYQNELHTALAPSRRAELCARVAETLIELHAGGVDAIAAELALLFEGARDADRASAYFLRAARQAAAMSAQREAVSLTRRAIEHAAGLPGRERAARGFAGSLQLAQLQQNLGSFEASIEAFAQAERHAEAAEDVEGRIEAVCGMAGSRFYLKDIDESLRQGERALAIAQAAGSDLGVARAEAVEARALLCRGAIDRSEALYARAIPRLVENAGPQALDAVAFHSLLHAWRLEYDEFDRRARWWIDQTHELGVRIFQMYWYQGMCLGNRGRWGEARDLCERSLRLAELNGDVYHVCRLPNTLGWLASERQDLELALERNRESARLGEELGFEEAEANAHVNLGQNLLALGELDRAEGHLERAAALFREDVWFRWRYEIRLRATQAELCLARGELPGAKAWAAASLELARGSRARKHVAFAHLLLGEVARLEERMEDARREYRAALGSLAGHPCPSISWRIHRACADLAARLRDSEAAAACRGRARADVESLAGSLRDDGLARRFLASEAVRSLG